MSKSVTDPAVIEAIEAAIDRAADRIMQRLLYRYAVAAGRARDSQGPVR